MKRLLACALVTATLCACGQHSGTNRSSTQSGDIFSGRKPTTPAERMQDAITRDDFTEASRLLDTGFDVNALLPNGRTPLIDATVQSRFRIMAELLKRGADRSARGRDGKTALEHAVAVAGRDENGEPVVNRALVLLDDEAQISKRREMMKYAGRGSADPLLRLLREVGVDPNFVDESGDTPLTLAVRKRKTLAVEVLARWADCPGGTGQPDCLRLTATDVNLPDAAGTRPLAHARALDPAATEIVDVLLEQKAKE